MVWLPRRSERRRLVDTTTGGAEEEDERRRAGFLGVQGEVAELEVQLVLRAVRGPKRQGVRGASA